MEVAPSEDCLLGVRGRGERFEWRVSVVAAGKGGSAARVRIDRAREEAAGPLRATVLVDGAIELGNRTLRLEARLHFFASLPVVRFEIRAWNPRRALHRGGFWELGDPGSVLFQEISVRVELPEPPVRTLCYPEPDLSPVVTTSPMAIYQDSSGGVNWQSTVHVNREGRVPHRFRGYRVDGLNVSTAGLRASPIVLVEHPDGPTAVCVWRFWQNFPKVIEADDAGLTVGLFPKQFGDLHELQGGEQKTHVVGLAFGPDSVGELPLSWIMEPSVLTADPEWYVLSEAVPRLTPTTQSTEVAYEALVSSAIDGADTFEQKRERIDEYGWRHFGDLYADHETVGHTGEQRLVSHYNNQYDAILGFAIQFMRSGDLRWWAAMEELAPHVIDIDLYHTSEDKPAYNGGLFWHTAHYTDAGRSTHRTYPSVPGTASGGPGNEHNYSTGLLLHYFLTGYVPSREAVLELADWVMAMDDGRRTMLRWLSRRATGLASATASTRYHGPGRGAGNSIATLLNAYRLTGEQRYLGKAEALIHRCIHPDDDLNALNLLDAERRWSYTVFLQVLGRYLEEKTVRQELDACSDYARQSVLHYAKWMVAQEHPYLDKPELLEHPTETWAAQDIRKAEVLAVAAKHAPVEDRGRLLERADFFFQTSLDTLRRSPTRSFTRPVVILLSNGYSYSALRGVAARAPATREHKLEFGSPTSFTPQKITATRHAILLGAFLLLTLTALAFLWIVV